MDQNSKQSINEIKVAPVVASAPEIGIDTNKSIIDNIIAVYNEAGINLPTLEKDNNIIDIDPFTVFGLFNKSKLKLSNRLTLSHFKEFK